MNEAFDSFRVEEAYAWQDDIMEISRRIVQETDKARLSNIADHFKVDLSEIREFIEMKRLTKRKPITNADKIRTMTDEELMSIFQNMCCPYSLNMGGWKGNCEIETKGCGKCWLDWLRQDVKRWMD